MPNITFSRGRGKGSGSSPQKPQYRWLEDSPQKIKPVNPPGPIERKAETEKDPLVELESLIGLAKVKEIISEITAYAKIQKLRQAHSLKSEPLVLHMVFKGNPGTGKTTVARILGRLFQQIKILPKGHLVEIERADLVGEYIGHTAQKTRIQVNKALGGILFIDEAYSLARGGDKDFGKEAIDTLVKATEDHKNELIVILAGYKKEMDLFMLSNPGLKSRFPIQITFPDYKKEELMRIADQMAEDREYALSNQAKSYLHYFLMKFNASTLNFSNARLVRNLIERAIRKQASRLVRAAQPSKAQLMTLEEVDFTVSEGEEVEDRFYYI
jgi:stage V sporulation protein K